MTTRVLNVETDDGNGPGYTLNVYETGVRSFRAQVTDPEERLILAIASARLDGDSGLLESVATYFASGPHAHIGSALVSAARAELKMVRAAHRAEVGGLELAGVVMEALGPLLDAHPDIGVDACAAVAARASVELHRRYEIKERS